jgi:ERCC4-type nuclease
MNMTLLYDSREKKNSHILKFFEKNNISIKKEILGFGDYSFLIDDENYKNKIVIERKHSLDEFAINCTAKRKQFIAEMERAKKSNAKFILLLENSSLENIKQHKYRSRMHPNSMIGSLKAWKERYDIKVFFLKSEWYSGKAILFFFQEYYSQNML